jgi:hypothetical protein
MLSTCKLSSGLRAAIRTELGARAGTPPPPEPAAEDLVCPRCGCREPDVRWQLMRGGKRAIRATCTSCRTYIKFLPQVPRFVALADAAGGGA